MRVKVVKPMGENPFYFMWETDQVPRVGEWIHEEPPPKDLATVPDEYDYLVTSVAWYPNNMKDKEKVFHGEFNVEITVV
jgi:hypothetical protein